MTRLAPLWQQNSSYPANTDRVLLATLWPTSGSTGGAVTTVANTMNVSVAAGTAAVALNNAYTALCRWDAAEVVTLTAAPPAGQSRNDVIVLQVRDAALDAGSNNDFIFQAIAGTPATTGSQTTPAVPTNAYAVAQLTVPGGAANLNGVTVVDRRAPLLGPGGTQRLHGRVYRNAAFTVGTATAVFPWDTVQYDNAAMWRSAQSGFVVPAAGVYAITSQFTVFTPANSLSSIMIYQNGSSILQSNVYSAVANAYLTPVIASAVSCNAGDLLQIFSSGNGSFSLAQGLGGGGFTVDYLGTG
jgi:hypothetical protein